MDTGLGDGDSLVAFGVYVMIGWAYGLLVATVGLLTGGVAKRLAPQWYESIKFRGNESA